MSPTQVQGKHHAHCTVSLVRLIFLLQKSGIHFTILGTFVDTDSRGTNYEEIPSKFKNTVWPPPSLP